MSTLAVGTIKSISSAAPVFQNTSGTEIGTICKAYVNFNGDGTVAIRENFNVSSITDTGTGKYTINFTNALPTANYAVAGMSGKYQETATNAQTVFPNGTRTASAFAVRTVTASSSTNDRSDINLIFFAD